MSIDEVKTITEELRGRFDAPFNSSDKSVIEKLYGEVLGKTFVPTSCQQCYHDALIEIVCYLNKYGKMAEKSKYRLKAGAIINCTTFKDGKVFTNDNLTDDVAREYLERFPKQAVLFQSIPVEKKGGKKSGGKKQAEKPIPAPTEGEGADEGNKEVTNQEPEGGDDNPTEGEGADEGGE